MRALSLLALALLLAAPAQAQTWREPETAAVPTRPWIVDRSGLTAVPIPAQGWCEGDSGVVRLRVDALERAAFQPPRVRLQRFLSGVRFVVQQDCPGAEMIEVQGYAGGTRAFVGSLVRSEGWRLEGATLRP